MQPVNWLCWISIHFDWKVRLNVSMPLLLLPLPSSSSMPINLLVYPTLSFEIWFQLLALALFLFLIRCRRNSFIFSANKSHRSVDSEKSFLLERIGTFDSCVPHLDLSASASTWSIGKTLLCSHILNVSMFRLLLLFTSLARKGRKDRKSSTSFWSSFFFTLCSTRLFYSIYSSDLFIIIIENNSILRCVCVLCARGWYTSTSFCFVVKIKYMTGVCYYYLLRTQS